MNYSSGLDKLSNFFKNPFALNMSVALKKFQQSCTISVPATTEILSSSYIIQSQGGLMKYSFMMKHSLVKLVRKNEKSQPAVMK